MIFALAQVISVCTFNGPSNSFLLNAYSPTISEIVHGSDLQVQDFADFFC